MARSQLATAGLVIALLATPALAALTYAQLSGDASARPMSITVDSLRSGLFGKSRVEALVSIGDQGLSDRQKEDLTKQLKQTFAGREVPVAVKFISVPDRSESEITYTVGKNTVGPLPLRRASEGVRPAVEAYRLTLR